MISNVRTERSYLLMLFGLPFFLVGIGFLFWSIIPTLYDSWRMQSWLSVNGHLTYADLIVSHSDDSTTYRVDARYRYDVLGRQFTNDRVGINSGGDNIGDFQQQLGRQLENSLRRGQTVPVYFDPSNPQDSVLNRELRWGLLGFKAIFVLVFGGVGAGLIFWGYRGKQSISTPDADTRPWLTRPEWRGGVIRSGARGGMYAIWGFATIWNLISIPAAFQFTTVWREEGPVALLILLFPLVGIGLIGWAIKLTREWRRFGVTPLTMDPFPGSLGGDVGGVIQLQEPYTPGRVCRVTLSNILSYVSGSGKNRSRRESVKWQSDGYARIIPGNEGGSELQFRFAVPSDLSATEESSSRYHLWRLNVELDLEGVNLDRSFELPVFDTGETSRQLDFYSADERPAGIRQITPESLLPISRSGNTLTLDYRIFRHPVRSLMLLVFGSIFAGAGYFMWGEAASEGFMLYVMAAVFGLVGWAIVLTAVYSAFNSLRVVMDGHNLVSSRSLFGFTIDHQHYQYADVLAVESKQGMKSQSGNKHKIEYSVVAKLPGKKITLAEHLTSAVNRDLVIEFFEEEFLKSGSTFEID